MKELAWKHIVGSWWASRSPSERWLIAAAALVLGLTLYVWFLLSTIHARQRLLPAVTALRAQASDQNRQVAEIMRLRAAPPPVKATADLRQLLQRQVDASGLSRSLVSIERVDAHHVKLVFGNVVFAEWLAWADSVRAQHLRFATVRIESQATPGQVSASVTVERPSR